MYTEFFSLKERPYSMSPDPRFIYLTDQHSEALAKCEYTIQQKMGLSGMALPESQAALANRSRACWRGTVIRGYGLGRRLRTRGS
jgi:hypothetical protein